MEFYIIALESMVLLHVWMRYKDDRTVGYADKQFEFGMQIGRGD